MFAMKRNNKKTQKGGGLEKYLSGALLAFVWQVIFVKLVLGQAWSLTAAVAVMTALIFFIIAVLVFETSELKGSL